MNNVVPLGDQAALAYFADEEAALRLAAAARAAAAPWIVDVVQAYTSVALFFNLGRTSFREVAAWLGQVETVGNVQAAPGWPRVIPCCYEMQLDLARVATHLGRSAEEVIRLHGATEYTVYAIGFSPGFPYLGYLPPELSGVPRLERPRVRVEAGSVGLTGRQTGVYPEVRPGGWNLIGRTPLELVNVDDGYFPLRTGDRVRFDRIEEAEFRRRVGERL